MHSTIQDNFFYFLFFSRSFKIQLRKHFSQVNNPYDASRQCKQIMIQEMVAQNNTTIVLAKSTVVSTFPILCSVYISALDTHQNLYFLAEKDRLDAFYLLKFRFPVPVSFKSCYTIILCWKRIGTWLHISLPFENAFFRPVLKY